MRSVENALQDLRFAARSWGRAPGFAVAAVATLAVGIGANTAIFSVVSAALLQPLPFPAPENLARIYETQPRNAAGLGFDGPVVFQDLEEWRAHSRTIEAIAAYSNSARNLQEDGAVEQVATISAERCLFRLLGVPALIGRTFRDDDPLSVAVASYAFWRTTLGGDPAAVGRVLTLDGETVRLIGVMPETFQFPYPSAVQKLWLAWEAPADLRSHPTRRLEAVVARLKPGVGPDAARRELAAMEAASRESRLVRVTPLKETVSASTRNSLLILLGAVAMVLLIACLNVANLLLARAASRAREIAIRAAIGAGPSRLARQFLTESLLLAFTAGALGLGIGILGRRLLVQVAGPQLPRAEEIGLDWRVFAFLLAVCVATGVGFGLAPAIAAARGFSRGLGARSLGAAFRDSLVVGEIALAFLLLVGAGLLLRSFLNLQQTDPGLNAESVLTAHVVLAGGLDAMALEERVSQIPGVRAAGLISLLPLQDSNWTGGLIIPGKSGIYETELRYVTPGYFRAMRIPLRRGRELSSRDVAGAPTAILINEALARRCFPGEDPIGRKTDRGTIVGVVGDVRQSSLSVPAKPEVYYAVAQNFAQIRSLGSTLVARGEGPPQQFASAIRAAVRDVIPGQAVFRISTMRQVVEESLAAPRLYTSLMGLFAAIAISLAAAGIYSVVAYLVTLRTREFGIRMALGADTGRIVGLVMNRGAALTALGLALGAGGAALLARALRGALYGVGTTDPLTFVAVAVVLAGVALGACVGPAYRAARSDASAALRCD